MKSLVWKGDVDDGTSATGSLSGSESGSEDEEDDEEEEDSTMGMMEPRKEKRTRGTDHRFLHQAVEAAGEEADAEDDAAPTPVDGESQRDFYARTTSFWSALVVESNSDSGVAMSEKEAKKEGFRLAAARYYTSCLPACPCLSVCLSATSHHVTAPLDFSLVDCLICQQQVQRVGRDC